jgi:uncharacterized membrane protein YdjX (TVP38/TMEM64 family)
MMSGPQTRGFSWRKLLPLAGILLVAGIGFFTLRDYLSFQTLQSNQTELLAFRDQNYLLTLAGFVACYVVIVAFSLPGGAVASLTGGFLFGVFPGLLINISAATSGAILIFLAARFGLGETLSRKLEKSHGTINHIQKGLHENEMSYLFLMRLIPAIPFFAANLIPALIGVRLGRFVFTTFFGIIPGALVYTWVGAGLSEVFARGALPDMGVIFEPQILGPILGLVVLASLPIILKKLSKKKKV